MQNGHTVVEQNLFNTPISGESASSNHTFYLETTIYIVDLAVTLNMLMFNSVQEPILKVDTKN